MSVQGIKDQKDVTTEDGLASHDLSEHLLHEQCDIIEHNGLNYDDNYTFDSVRSLNTVDASWWQEWDIQLHLGM